MAKQKNADAPCKQVNDGGYDTAHGQARDTADAVTARAAIGQARAKAHQKTGGDNDHRIVGDIGFSGQAKDLNCQPGRDHQSGPALPRHDRGR